MYQWASLEKQWDACLLLFLLKLLAMIQKLLDVCTFSCQLTISNHKFCVFTVNACQKTKTSVKRQAGIASDLTQIVEASQQMENMLDTILTYVDDVMSGTKTADNTFGRSLLDMVHSVPKMTPEEFEEMLNSNRKVSGCLRALSSGCILTVNIIYIGSTDGTLSITTNQDSTVAERETYVVDHLIPKVDMLIKSLANSITVHPSSCL